MKDFDTFMSQLQETNQTLDFFCDFNYCCPLKLV